MAFYRFWAIILPTFGGLWTLEVCRIMAFYRFWASILPTVAGSGIREANGRKRSTFKDQGFRV